MSTAKRFRDKIRNKGKHEIYGPVIGPFERLKKMREHGVNLFPGMSKEDKAKLLYIEEE